MISRDDKFSVYRPPTRGRILLSKDPRGRGCGNKTAVVHLTSWIWRHRVGAADNGEEEERRKCCCYNTAAACHVCRSPSICGASDQAVLGMKGGSDRMKQKRKHVEEAPTLSSTPRPAGALAAPPWRCRRRCLTELHCPCLYSHRDAHGGACFTSAVRVSPMLSSGTMEEFVTEEEEPWYDQQDLEQGEWSPASCCQQPAASLTAAAPQRRLRWHAQAFFVFNWVFVIS